MRDQNPAFAPLCPLILGRTQRQSSRSRGILKSPLIPFWDKGGLRALIFLLGEQLWKTAMHSARGKGKELVWEAIAIRMPAPEILAPSSDLHPPPSYPATAVTGKRFFRSSLTAWPESPDGDRPLRGHSGYSHSTGSSLPDRQLARWARGEWTGSWPAGWRSWRRSWP